ncbi:hypothetical protein LJC56_04995 [Christensenellaceae bacterium OttesenSCG-928-K19]|nr:hypothetical protein [Christensenellaceae bacterium OttesenSCG-928-K19]
MTTVKTYDGYIQKHILPFFKPLDLTVPQVSIDHIQAFINQQHKSGLESNLYQ